MPKISCIYLDMDGVIANFEQRYEEWFGNVPEEERRTHFKANFVKAIENGIFQKLDKMPDADILLEFLRKSPVPTQILSSTAREEFYDDVSKQKNIWLQSHGITFAPNFVPGKQHKYKWAKPHTIIIDDTLSVIEDWRKAGGIAIWHKDAKSTISQLESYL